MPHAPVQNESPCKFLLVFGAARSGTSWIGKIFDSHPLTLYKHEPDRVLPGVPMAPRLEEAKRFAAPIGRFLSSLPALAPAHVAGSLPIFPKQYRSAIVQQIHKASVLASIAGASSFRVNLPILLCARPSREEITVVWKSIDSLSRLGVILSVVHNCRAIRITRHPCASISSTLRGEAQGKFSSLVSASEDYGIMRMFLEAAVQKRGLTLDHLKQLHPVERMAWIWVLANEKAEHDTRQTGCCMAVRYEDVCLNPVAKTKEMFSFSSLSWNRQTEDFIKASTLGTKPGAFDQLTQNSRRYYGIFRDPIQAAEKWKTQMRPEDIDRVYKVLRESDLIRLYPESEPTQVQAAV